MPDILVTGSTVVRMSAGVMGFLREFQRHGAAGANPRLQFSDAARTEWPVYKPL